MLDPAQVAEEQVNNINCVVFVYKLIEDPADKFILMAGIQLGYTQDMIARMLDIPQPTVSERLRQIRKLLKLKEPEIIF